MTTSKAERARNYDVAIVGAGIAGSILARHLVAAGKSVIMLEAGESALEPARFESFVEQYHTSSMKIPSSPYPLNHNAPTPTVLDHPSDSSAYGVQRGQHPYGSTYIRNTGGTTLHWLGTCLRMLPNDMRLQSEYGVGVDWPITYGELEPYYQQAEWEIGVAADVSDQKGHGGLWFADGYEYPMSKVPQSYSDLQIAAGLKGERFAWHNGSRVALEVVSTPAGRNSTPRKNVRDPRYADAKPGAYRPVGSLHNPDEMGERCVGNSSCVPICPAQAKYTALKSLKFAADDPRRLLTLIDQAVAYIVQIDNSSGRVKGIRYKKYNRSDRRAYTEETAKAKLYVLATHAVESAKLLLASDVANSSGLVGCHLMDHPSYIAWGLMPKPIGSYRGPGSTSGIPGLRDGEFRKELAACRIEVGNWGWSWPTAAPFTTVYQAVGEGKFGKELRNEINDIGRRQFRIAYEFEQLPNCANRVRIDRRYKDRLGICRPVFEYSVSDYCQKGLATAKVLASNMFKALGAQERTKVKKDSPYYLEDIDVDFHPPGHAAGTHRMGHWRHSSVVDTDQRTWDHDNLYLVGSGNMPTIGTSNPTLTLAALTFKAKDAILRHLERG